MNPGRVKSEGSFEYFGGSICVIIYNNLMFVICPNPKKEVAEEAERLYKLGQYVSRTRLYLTQKQFDDPTFWND